MVRILLGSLACSNKITTTSRHEQKTNCYKTDDKTIKVDQRKRVSVEILQVLENLGKPAPFGSVEGLTSEPQSCTCFYDITSKKQQNNSSNCEITRTKKKRDCRIRKKVGRCTSWVDIKYFSKCQKTNLISSDGLCHCHIRIYSHEPSSFFISFSGVLLCFLGWTGRFQLNYFKNPRQPPIPNAIFDLNLKFIYAHCSPFHETPQATSSNL